jgi:hypothetical protein
MLKPNDQIDELGDESEEICEKGLLDHFTQRPEELRDVCLAEFASMYEFKRASGKEKLQSVEEEFGENGKKINCILLKTLFLCKMFFLESEREDDEVPATNIDREDDEVPATTIEIEVDLPDEPQPGTSNELYAELQSRLQNNVQMEVDESNFIQSNAKFKLNLNLCYFLCRSIFI